MSRWLCAALVGVVGLFSAGVARAEVGEAPSPGARVFDDAGFNAAASKAIASEIASVERTCEFHEFSREGPSEKELARCAASVAKLVKRGPSAIGPVLAAIDKDSSDWNVRRRLYDVLARTRDARLVEPLIRGMARITMRKIDSRSWEPEIIHEALAELTRAPIGGQAPWVAAPVRSARRSEIDRIVDWRLWQSENSGLSHEELAARRLEAERAHQGDASPERAYQSVVYLLEKEPAEGIAAAKKLAARTDLPEIGQRELTWRIQQAEEAAAEAAKKARASAPAKAKARAAKVPAKKAQPVGLTLS